MIGLLTNLLKPNDKGGSTTDSGSRDTPTGPSPSESTDTLTHPDREDRLVQHLVDEFQNGAVSDDQIKVLRKHLNFDKSDGMEVKLEHLGNKVTEFEAYLDALETFLNEEGTAEEILDGLRADIRELRQTQHDVTGRIDTIEDDQVTVHDQLTQLDDGISSVEQSIEDLDGRHSREITGVDAKIERAEATFDESIEVLEDELTAVRNRVEDVESLRETFTMLESDVEDLKHIESTIETLQAELDDLQPLPDEISEIQSTIADLETLHDDVDTLKELEDHVHDLETLPDELDEIHESLADFEQFRSKLVNTVTQKELSSAD